VTVTARAVIVDFGVAEAGQLAESHFSLSEFESVKIIE
jgi:hypothetical protein